MPETHSRRDRSTEKAMVMYALDSVPRVYIEGVHGCVYLTFCYEPAHAQRFPWENAQKWREVLETIAPQGMRFEHQVIYDG